ncbi:MAG: hydrogenase [Chloroflexota bacterium]|nr:hydrogenase [Chloroflexota bacterium]
MASAVPTLSFWAPLVCLAAFLIVIGITYLFRNRGEEGYKKGTEQTKIFLSGEEPPEEEQRHVRAHNIYWGFFQAFKQYYGPTIRAHSGIINDYIIWFVATAAAIAVALFIAGVI